MDKVYPKHLYEPIRIKIATNYMKQDLRKLLPNVRGKKTWEEIDNSLDNWFKKNPYVKGPRNFWNGFHGMAMGFKLKIGLLQVLTAENIVWKFEEKLPINNKLASGGNLKYIDERLSEKRPTASRLVNFFSKEKELAKKWKIIFSEHGSTSEPRDNFPIIGMEEPNNKKQIISIHDGNRRMILAILEKKQTIPAYIGSYVTKKRIPVNFWLPTSNLMDIMFFLQKVDVKKDQALFNQYVTVLKNMLRYSESGIYELKKRVLWGKGEFGEKILSTLNFKTRKVP